MFYNGSFSGTLCKENICMCCEQTTSGTKGNWWANIGTVYKWIWMFCYEAKIVESEKAGSRQELKPGQLWHEPPVLFHWAMTTGQPPALTILYMYCIGGTEYLSRTPGSHSVCAVRTPVGVNRKILSIRKEPMVSGLFSLNALNIGTACHWRHGN